MARKRVIDQTSRIERLQAELLEAQRAQLAYAQKQFEALENDMVVADQKLSRLLARISKETENIQRYEALREQAIGRKSNLIQEKEELDGIIEELEWQHSKMLAEADELPEEVTEAQ